VRESAHLAEYQVLARNARGDESFLSEPRRVHRPAVVVAASPGGPLEREHSGFTGAGYLKLSRTGNIRVEIPLVLPHAGTWSIDLRYANGNGPVNTEDKVAVRTASVAGRTLGVFVMPQRGPGRWSVRTLAVVLLAALAGPAHAQASRQQVTVQGAGRYLVMETLTDDLLLFELGAGIRARGAAPIATSPMVSRTRYPGARQFSRTADGIETADLSVSVAAATLCFSVTDKVRRVMLTTICPSGLSAAGTGVSVARGAMQHVYGLGEQFTPPGQSAGDWTGRERVPGNAFGNLMYGYEGGAVGNAQFPVMYAVGEQKLNYALFLDDVYAQRWDFRTDPWRVSSRGDAVRGYVITGPDLPDLRRDYMDLVGRPPVPPRQAFGLWVSEYGYDHWHELESKLATLRSNRFPVDGFVLDLQWFGGIITGSDRSPMGSLSWDLKRFPDPRGQVARLRAEHGVGIIPIEEPYIARGLPEHDALARGGHLVRRGPAGAPVYLDYNPWWGQGGMLDYTSDAAGRFWHDWKRQPLVDLGVTGHWTDLGEPEQFDSTAWYRGVLPGRHAEADVHNLYYLKWSQSVFDGYRRKGVRRRPLILSRSGTSGSQRYGVAMWSGDIGANAGSLASHYNAQMHMSMSGVDYFGSDIGGFHRGAIRGDSLSELYTQWFAGGAMLDVPVRAHTENLCNCKETAPDRVGHRPSNLAALRLRYSLTPYYYSLAHRARLHGEPVVAPLVHYYQDDVALRTIGDEKLIGSDLLVAVVAQHGQRRRDVYLPRGTWYDFHSNAQLRGGMWIRDVPLYQDSLFRLPLYARAGAVIPRMHVDSQTMNVSGRRLDGTSRNELIARVYADATGSGFELHEDDGETIAYLEGARATTLITQRATGDLTTVTVGARAPSR